MNRDERLASLLERNVRLETERKERSEDIRELHKEVASAGYDLPAFRLVVKRAMEADDKKRKRETAEQIAESMMAALGVLGDMPLGVAALERAVA